MCYSLVSVPQEKHLSVSQNKQTKKPQRASLYLCHSYNSISKAKKVPL